MQTWSAFQPNHAALATASLIAPDYGISVAAIYHPVNGQLAEVAGSGGVSPVDAPRTLRNDEAKLADGWFNTITSEVFG